MTHRDDLDRLLSAWLDDPFTPPAPHYLGRVLERTRQTRQRPAWASLERWIPMADKVLQPTTAPPLRMARLLLIALLVLALAGAIAFVGSRLLAPTPVIPQGGSAVFAYSSIAGDQSVSRRRHLSRASGRHRYAPAHQRARDRNLPDVVAGWHAHRLPRLGGRRRFPRRHGRGRRQCDDTGHDRRDPGGLHARRPELVAGRDESHLPDQPGVRRSTFELFIVPTDGSSPATRLLAPGLEGHSADWSPDGKQIAFLGRDATGSVGFYVVDAGQGDAPGRRAPGTSDPCRSRHRFRQRRRGLMVVARRDRARARRRRRGTSSW